jgi:hypothetical protein
MPIILLIEGWDQEVRSLRPAWANSSRDLISKITREKWSGGVAQVVECLLWKKQDETTSKKKKNPVASLCCAGEIFFVFPWMFLWRVDLCTLLCPGNISASFEHPTHSPNFPPFLNFVLFLFLLYQMLLQTFTYPRMFVHRRKLMENRSCWKVMATKNEFGSHPIRPTLPQKTNIILN